MYIKLALRNLRRSARDYGIYFLTVAVTVALMESFLALACARDVLSLSENMGILTTGIVGVSVLVALLSSCVIAYGVGFMLGQRKQEFALYQLMGMELRTVQRMFFWENGLLGLAAFGLGALLGTGLAGVLAQGVWWIFQTPHQYQVVASPKALGMTFLLFLLMYGVGALRAGRVLRRQSIQGLLTSCRANEVPGRWRPGRWFLLVAPALTGMALGLLLLRKALDMQTNGAWAYLAGGGGLLLGGVYALYRGLPGLLLAAARRRPKVKYSRGRLFYLGQMGARVATAGRVLAVTGILLTLALTALFVGLALGSGYRANMEAYYPYDAGVAVDAPLTKQSAQPLLAAVNRQCPVEDSVTYFLYETPYGTEAMALSDYNHLRRILDLEEAELGPGEYLVHCDTWNFWEEIQQSLAQAPMLSLAGQRLTPGTPSLRTEPMEQYQMAGERGYALVVPDQVAQSLPEKGWRVVMDLQGGGTAALREEIRTFLHSAQWRPQLLPGRTMPEKVTMGVSVQAWGVANSLTGFTTLSFCGLYLSLVILLLSCTIGLSPALRPGQKSAAVCHSPAARGGQADPEPLDGLGTGDLFPPPVSPAGGGDGASECGYPAADGARGFAARGVSPVRSGGSGDLRRGVRPLFRGDLPAVPPERGIEGRETEPPRREDFAAGRFHVKRGVICPRPQTPPQSPEREAG